MVLVAAVLDVLVVAVVPSEEVGDDTLFLSPSLLLFSLVLPLLLLLLYNGGPLLL